MNTKEEKQFDFKKAYGDSESGSEEVHITMFDIENAIEKIKEKSSAGPDKLAPIVIKKCSKALIWPIY